MKNSYTYFEDNNAISEIRKHKWLESEKAGRDIGFATAALDWIKKHGEAYKAYYLPPNRKSKY